MSGKKKSIATGNKHHMMSSRHHASDPLAESRGVGERFEDPITGKVIEADDRIYLRDRPWSRTELLKWVARDNDGMSPVWPDTGKQMSERDLAALGIRQDRELMYDPALGEVVQTGRGGGGGGGGFHGGGGGFRGGGFGGGFGGGLLGGALVGGALAAGAYGPYGYGGYGGYGYGAPYVDPYYPYGRRRVIAVAHKANADEEERREYMMQRLRARHAKRMREEKMALESESRGGRHARNSKGEFTDARGGHHDRNAKGQFTDARGGHHRNAKGEFTGARTRRAALRDEVDASLDQDTYHDLYWHMKAEDREMVQNLIRQYIAKADLKGRIDDSVESNRLIENGLLPYVDHFTGERGIMPDDAMVYRGRVVSRRGFLMWLEDHKHDEMPPTMFDNSELERDDLERSLDVHPEEYEFFRRRREMAALDGVDAKYRPSEMTRDDDEMRRRARQYKEDFDAGRIKPTRDDFRALPFREYLNAEDWSHLM